MPSPHGQLSPYFDFYHQTEEQNFFADFVDEEIRIARNRVSFYSENL